MITYKGIEYDINPKQRKFVEEYLKDFNGTQSAIRSGYSPKTGDVQASRMLGNVKVQAYLRKRQEELVEIIKLDQLTTLKEIQKRAFFDPRKFYREDGSLKSPCELDDAEAAALAGMETVRQTAGRDDDGKAIFETVDKIKFADKDKSLELLATIQGLKIDKTEIDVTDVTGVIRLPAKKPVGAPVGDYGDSE